MALVIRLESHIAIPTGMVVWSIRTLIGQTCITATGILITIKKFRLPS
jgi:hypothetical protein